MGFVGLLSGAGDYLSERWSAMKDTFGESWTKKLPEAWTQGWSGLFTMAMAPQMPWSDDPNRDSFGRGVRLWLDGSFGVLGSGLSGTFGAAFQAPGLHEVGAGLDAAYRWGIARPISSGYLTVGNAAIAADDARKRGDDPLSAYTSALWSGFWHDTAWGSEAVGKVTPGQAAVWAAGGLVGATFSNGDTNWLRNHDPRTPHGQAAFNSEESDTVLKYTSGTLDFFSAIVGDPAHGAALVTKARLDKARNVATADYIMKGGLEKEISSKHLEGVYKAAQEADNYAVFHKRVMNDAPFGARAALPLWVAAKISKELFIDTYLVARGLASVKGSKLGDSWARIREQAPQIYSSYARIFANWNIGTDAQNIARRTSGEDMAISELALTDFEAFQKALDAGDGAWGRLQGSLFRTAQPKVKRISDLREGAHWWILYGKPITLARPFGKAITVGGLTQKAARRFMPSQGYTAFLDLMDGTNIGIRQFRALVERSGMPMERVEHHAALYGAQGFPEGRYLVYQNAREEAIKTIAAKRGVDPKTVEAALPEISRYQSAAKGFVEKQRIYLTEGVAQRSALYQGRRVGNEAKYLRDEYPTNAATRKGAFGTSAIVIPNMDGETQVLDMQDARIMPGLAPDPQKAALLSQTERYAPTLDFRALDAQLKYWKWIHEPTVGARGLTLAAAGRTKRAWDSMITAGDLVMMVWKSSALLRPAQLVRNLADDVLRRILVLDKLPFMMSLMTVPKRSLQNANRRGEFAHDLIRDVITKRRAQRSAHVEVDGMYEWPKQESPERTDIVQSTEALKGGRQAEAEAIYDEGRLRNIGDAWVQGLISWKVFLEAIQAWTAHPYRHEILGEVDPLVTMFYEGIFGKRPQDTARPNATESKRPAPPAAPVKPAGPEMVERPVLDKDGNPEIMTYPDGSPVIDFKTGKPKIRMMRVPAKKFSLEEPTGPVGPSPFSPPEISLNKYGLSSDRMDLFTRLMGEFDETAGYKDNLPPADAKVLKGINLEREFKRRILTLFAEQIGDTVDFLGTGWNREARKEVMNVAEYLKAAVDQRRDESEGAKLDGVVIDPMNGEMETVSTLEDVFTIIKETTKEQLVSKQTGEILPNAALNLERFILDHLDDLLRPEHGLGLRVDPNGHIRMSVVRYKPEINKAKVFLRKTPYGRLKDFPIKEKIDAGHEAITIRLPNGNTKTITLGAFHGEEGESYRHRISARKGNATANLLTGEFAQNRLLRESGGFVAIEATDSAYTAEWERVVNGQIAGDPVAKMFLQGASEYDVIKWLETTREGTKYIRRMKHMGSHYVMHVSTVKAMVDEYVPYANTDAGRALRHAVLNRVASRKHLNDVVPEADQRPIHGFSVDYLFGRGAVFHRVARAIESVQGMLFDMPTDVASRFPFFAESYRRHLNELVSLRMRTAAKAVNESNEMMMGDDGLRRVTAKDQPDEYFVSADELDRYNQMARDRAFHDTKYYLYDVAQMNDLARLFRLIVPFSSAIMDSYVKYGRIIKNNPAVILQGLYYWEMFERNETVQDENGYVSRRDAAGQDHWYSKDPETGEMKEVPPDQVGKHRYVQFRLPSALGNMVGKKYYGVDMNPVVAINKKSFNVFLDLPSTGPMVAIPVNEFALSNPEFGESEVIRKFVLPFGPSVNRAGWIPANIRSAWGQFDAEDGNTAEGQAKAIFQAELIAYGRKERTKPPSFAEVRERAALLKSLRFMNTWVSPASFSLQSPYQPYIDAYRQLAAIDPATADEKFLTQHGDEFYAVAMSVTRNNAGVRATLDSHKSFLRHKDLIEQYPELAGLIVGADAGPFSKAVYEAQKELPLRTGSQEKVREIMSLDESVQELEKRRVWDDYSKMMDMIRAEMVDMGITSLRGRQAQNLVRTRDAFIEANKYWMDPASGERQFSPWYNDFTAVDHAQMDKRIESLWKLVQDEDLQKRDDIRGLVEYLSIRERAQEDMRQLGVATLNNQRARRIRDRWDNSVHSLVEENSEFAGLWSRWLSQDDELTVGGV